MFSLLLSSSDSENEAVEKTEFITCFGEDDDYPTSSKQNSRRNNLNSTKKLNNFEDDDNDGVVQGPVLPTEEYRRLLYIFYF